METAIASKKWEVCEIQLRYKTNSGRPSDRPKIVSSKDAETILREAWDEYTIELFESFKLLLVNRANRVMGIFNVSNGGIAGTVADPKLIFVAAIKTGASGIILAHNHPSGNLSPSQADIDLTKKIKEGGRLLDISVLDHVILTRECYYSFADEGLM